MSMSGLSSNKENVEPVDIREELSVLKKEIMSNPEPISGKVLRNIFNMIRIHMQGREKLEIYTPEDREKMPKYKVSLSSKGDGSSYKTIEVIYEQTVQYSYIIQGEEISIKKNNESSITLLKSSITDTQIIENTGEIEIAMNILKDIEEYFTPYTKITDDTNE